MDRKRLVDQLTIHEGLRLKPYLDSVGKLSVGIGRNLADKGISTGEAVFLLGNDIDEALGDCERFPWYAQLDPVRQNALVELCFNLGLSKLREFKRFLAALSTGNYPKAAAELLDSKWASQVGPVRSGRIIKMVREGRWPL